jgi:hypothetical protein
MQEKQRQEEIQRQEVQRVEMIRQEQIRSEQARQEAQRVEHQRQLLEQQKRAEHQRQQQVQEQQRQAMEAERQLQMQQAEQQQRLEAQQRQAMETQRMTSQFGGDLQFNMAPNMGTQMQAQHPVPVANQKNDIMSLFDAKPSNGLQRSYSSGPEGMMQQFPQQMGGINGIQYPSAFYQQQDSQGLNMSGNGNQMHTQRSITPSHSFTSLNKQSKMSAEGQMQNFNAPQAAGNRDGNHHFAAAGMSNSARSESNPFTQQQQQNSNPFS